MADTDTVPSVKSVDRAPFVYFDLVAANGVLNGAIQIELAANTLVPLKNGGVLVEAVSTCKLRCSPAAALFLKQAIEHSLNMLQDPSAAPQAKSAMN